LRFRQERKRFSRRRTEALETCLCESRFARSRRVLCRWLGTGSVANTDPTTHPDTYPDPYPNPYPNPNPNTKSNTKSNTNTNTNTKSNATNTNSNPYTLLKSHI
jgi:hypothetical protein